MSMFGYECNGFVSVRSGVSNGRSFGDHLLEGTVRINGKNPDGCPIERIVRFKDGEIQDNRLKVKGQTVHHIVYGKFETTMTQKGREVTSFRKGRGRGLHGLAKRFEKLFGHAGVCHSWYKRGRLVRQKFFYDNRRPAYDWNGFSKSCEVRDYDGRLLYEITGALDGRNNCYLGGMAVLDRKMQDWFLQSMPFEVKKRGKVVYKGQWENRQRVGEWIEGGKSFFYERGVAIPKKLYLTPVEKLDPVKILQLPNAQLRMALSSKIGPERIAECGKVIHKDRQMRLLSIKGYDVNILRVQCPSTKVFYFLRVPKDAKKCEEARQWTFGVGNGFPAPIKFAREV